MKITKFLVIVGLIVGVLSSSGNASSEILSDYRAKCDAGVREIEGDHKAVLKKILSRYAKSLDAVSERAKKRGDLDTLVVALKERKLFKEEKVVPAEARTEVSEVERVRATYRGYIDHEEIGKNKRIVVLLEKYNKALKSLQKRNVMDSKIDEAILVRTEIERNEFVLADIKSRIPVEEKPKPRPVASSGARTYITSVIISENEKSPSKYECRGKWNTDRGGGRTTAEKAVKGTLYLHIEKTRGRLLSGKYVCDVLLYNKKEGQSSEVGAPDDYENVGYWDCVKSVDAFGKKNGFNVSLCVSKKGDKMLLDVQMSADAKLGDKGYVANGQVDGVTLWVKYRK